ncbi:MAG TPA: membrane protein insertase YidC [Chromatiales bacterium]|nr:membrane protein insertase YidC [Chromatiales bacterium]
MDSQRLILIIAFSFVMLLMWQAWNEDQAALVAQQQASTSPVAQADVPAAAAEAPAARDDVPTTQDQPAAQAVATAGQQVRVVTDVLDVVISTRGGVIQRADLRGYPVSLDQPDQPVRLLNDAAGLINIAQSGLRSPDGPAPDHYAAYVAANDEYRLGQGDERIVVPLTWEQDGVKVTKTYTFTRGSYKVDVAHEVHNGGSAPWSGSQYRQLQRNADGGGMALVYTYTGGVYAGTQPDGERRPYEKVSFEDMGKVALDAQLSNGWVAMIQHYFVGAWIPDNKDEANRFYTLTSQNGGALYTLGMMSPARAVEPGASTTFASSLYIGPKIADDLEALAEGLELTVDYGMLHFIAKPIFWLLNLFHDWVGNWGWAIVLVTVLIKLVFYRLSESSYRSMANMRKLQPKLQALKERHGDNKQKFSEEMMKLYRTEKINPLGGCLPILVQIPVFIALYWVLVESVELRQAPFILWINDLTAMDPYFVLPVLMGISMWLQHRLNPQPMDEMQRKIFMILPPVFTVFFAFFPAGLVLYWVVNNVLSIAQQWVINKRMGAV